MAKKIKIPYLDYACKVGERVMWRTIVGKVYEGVILEWNDSIATIQLDDGLIMPIKC